MNKASHLMWGAVLLIGWGTCPASASLIGDDVTLTQTLFGNVNFGPETAVGSTTDTEWIVDTSPLGAFVIAADIVDENTITISLESFVGATSANGFEYLFTDLDWGGAGTVDAIGPITFAGSASATVAVVSPTSVLVSDTQLFADSFGVSIASITFDLVPSHVIPEPTTATLGLIMGLGVLGIARRRRT